MESVTASAVKEHRAPSLLRCPTVPTYDTKERPSEIDESHTRQVTPGSLATIGLSLEYPRVSDDVPFFIYRPEIVTDLAASLCNFIGYNTALL